MSSKRLQRVVRVRRLWEGSRAAELGRSRNALEEARRELDEAGRRLDAHDRDARDFESDPVLEDSARRYRGALAKGRGARARDVEQHIEQVQVHRRSVEEAHRDLRLMEELHDRVQARELQHASAEDAKAHDALALAAYIRNRGIER
jgi:flagellar biosynthesis chaperone FliJ